MLDTHVLVRWLFESKKLSRAQFREIQTASLRGEPLALSAISLLEIALLVSADRPLLKVSLGDFLGALQTNPAFQLLPLTPEIALDVASLVPLKDPFDRAIAATARVHCLKLVTSDQRIINSALVPIIE